MIFKKLIPLAVLAALSMPAGARELEQESVGKKLQGFEGCFVLLDVKSGKYFRYNAGRCDVPLSPCSTFKIFNSLVGLDSGVLAGKDHTFKWDGKKREIDSWNQDQTLASAVKNSTVWYFQKVASLVGSERMRKYIDVAHYGNGDLSAGLTRFWLGTSLKISANEQVDFLEKLYLGQLPFSGESMKAVREILQLEATANGTLSGKTGSHAENNKGILGWFVGWVVHGGNPYIFATNITASDGASGPRARQITKEILCEAELL